MKKFFKSGLLSSDSEEEEEKSMKTMNRNEKTGQKKTITTLQAFLQESNSVACISGRDLLKNIEEKAIKNEKKSEKRRKRKCPYDSDSDSEEEDDGEEVNEVTDGNKKTRKENNVLIDDNLNNKYTSPLTSQRCQPPAPSSLTLGDLLKSDLTDNELGVTETSSYFAKAKQTRKLSEHISSSSLRNKSTPLLEDDCDTFATNSIRNDITPGGGNDDDDEWMESATFQDLTSSNQLVITKKKGRSKKTRKTNSTAVEDNEKPVHRNKDDTTKRAIVTVRKVKGNDLQCEEVWDDCDVESQRPYFSDIPFVDPNASSLVLKYKEKTSTSISTKNGEDNKKDFAEKVIKTAEVPSIAMRYLKTYQVQGVEWLWSKYAKGLGK